MVFSFCFRLMKPQGRDIRIWLSRPCGLFVLRALEPKHYVVFTVHCS